MSNPTLASWQGVTPVYLGNPAYNQNGDTYKAEPSGLTIYTDGNTKWLFMVSDNGILAKAALPSSGTPTGTLDWQINPTPDDSDKAYDYESVSFANGNVMIGVEGDRGDSNNPTSPSIKRFNQDNTGKNNQAGAFTGSVWTLNGIDFNSKTNKGMEGMTFVPWGSYPSSWTGDASPHYGGIFFVSVQADYAQIYVYDLAQGGDGGDGTNKADLGATSNPLTVPTVGSAPAGSQPLMSDLCFDAGSDALYVLYDGGKDSHNNNLSNDYLQKLSISTSDTTPAAGTTAPAPLSKVWDYELPWLNCEGLAIDGDDLYVSVDDGDTPSNNGIFVLKGVLSKL